MSKMTLEYLSPDEVAQIGFAKVGSHVQIDRTCRFIGASRIEIGSHVRLDAYTTIRAGAGGVSIGSYVHIAPNVSISGAAAVTIEDFAGISNGVSIFASNDDYSGGAMANPMVADAFRNVSEAPVCLQRHALIGAHSVVLPGVTIGRGASIGALSLVNKSIPEFLVVTGNPPRKVGTRKRDLLELEKQFVAQEGA